MPVRPLSPALAEKAKNDLNEDPKRLESDLQHLKDWIAKQPHLRARTDDQWLVAFLRGCKFSLERTKEKLDLYYTLRSTLPEFHQIRHTDPIFDEILSLGCVLMLPKLPAPDFPRIFFFQAGAHDPEKHSMVQIMSVSFILQRIVFMEDDNAIVAGTVNVMDLEKVGMGHFLQITPSLMKKMVVASQEALPLRMKGAHYLNTPPGFESLFNVMKGFMNEKNKSRLFIHNKDFEALYKYIPKEVLPQEYGGEAGTIDEIIETWRQKVKQYHSFLEEDYKYGTDESKRPGKPKTSESMFGLEGSFRKLELD